MALWRHEIISRHCIIGNYGVGRLFGLQVVWIAISFE
jgi:hypothetical protein